MPYGRNAKVCKIGTRSAPHNNRECRATREYTCMHTCRLQLHTHWRRTHDIRSFVYSPRRSRADAPLGYRSRCPPLPFSMSSPHQRLYSSRQIFFPLFSPHSISFFLSCFRYLFLLLGFFYPCFSFSHTLTHNSPHAANVAARHSANLAGARGDERIEDKKKTKGRWRGMRKKRKRETRDLGSYLNCVKNTNEEMSMCVLQVSAFTSAYGNYNRQRWYQLCLEFKNSIWRQWVFAGIQIGRH